MCVYERRQEKPIVCVCVLRHDVTARGTPVGWLGVDPVDTAAVPAAWLRMPTFSADAANAYSPKSLVFGTGLGSEAPACAPTGVCAAACRRAIEVSIEVYVRCMRDVQRMHTTVAMRKTRGFPHTGFNHVQFFEHCTSAPAWHVVAPAAGHVDMLDDDVGLISKAFCRLCKPSRVPKVAVRSWLSGAMAAFMKPGCIDEFLARPSPELDIVVANRTVTNLVAAS